MPENDSNFVLIEEKSIIHPQTGQTITVYVYNDIKAGRKITVTRPKHKALDKDKEPAMDVAGTGKTTAASTEGKSQEASEYATNPVESKVYSVMTTISGEDGDTYEDKGATVHLGKAPRSLFNAWTLHRFANRTGQANFTNTDTLGTDYNKPVMFDGGGKSNPENNNKLNPTARNIVEYANVNGKECFSYSYSDFIQMEHYGQISNDYLITLRRFAYPVPDDLLTPIQHGTDAKEIDTSQPDLARAVTWLSPALGNNLEEILKFKTALKWTKAESSIQEAASQTKDRGTMGDKVASSPLASSIESGLGGFTAAQAQQLKKHGNVDYGKATYPNKVFGPLNIIDNVLARDKGLEFDQEFKLSFHYDLKSYKGTSPKVAFMDTLSNVLALTFNNAPFWGGATRFSGNGHSGKPFGDSAMLAKGDYAGYIGSIADTLSGMGGNFMDQLKKTASNVKNKEGINKIMGDSSILENIVGGGLMKMLGGPGGGDVIKAFLTGDPTGQWHVTIGNPMNPIIVCGNLCLQESNVSFEGPLGFEGFPTKMKVEITLKPGRPRDKTEIESMFNAGRGRMYLQPEWMEEGEGLNVDSMINVNAYGGKSGDNIKNAPYMSKLSDMSAG